MSWSRRIAVAALLLGISVPLTGCSFSPVYGGSGALTGQPLLNLAYAKPNSRIEQIIYQDLALRFGSSDASTAPLATVFASASSTTVGLTATANPAKPLRVTVTATLTITQRDGTIAKPLKLVRHATADYSSTNGVQVLVDTSAATEATERATKAVAESLRLALLAALSR